KQLPTLLETFDYPHMNPNCLERRESTVAPQALHLMNGGMLHQLAEHFADRVQAEVGTVPAKQIERVYLIALGRLPSDEEREIGLAALQRLADTWARHVSPAALADRTSANHKALATYCHAIMNSAAFLYVD